MSMLGIDLGTSGLKCATYNEDGKMIGKTYGEYHLYMPKKGMVELDPNIVWDKLTKILKELNNLESVKKDPIEVLSISVSGDEALPVDKTGNPIYNTIMSMDKRGEEEKNWTNNIIGEKRIYEITGQPPAQLFPLHRLLWLKNNKPEIFKNIYKFLGWEEFVFQKLGAAAITDYSVACRTLAFDIKKKNYSEEILKKVDLDMDLFPDAVLSGTEIGSVNKVLHSELGFKKNVKIVAGGFDQVCTSLGSGVIRKKMTSVGTGTMEVIHTCCNKPIADEKFMNYGYSVCNHALKDMYLVISVNYCGGVIFKWYRDNFAYNERGIAEKNNLNVYDVIMDLALKSKYPVLFLPYFEGSQTPRNNPYVTGAILGMTLRTSREDIVKGMLEGITFALRLNLENMQDAGIEIGHLKATGGGARSDTWLQIKADITGKQVEKIEIDETGCMAAAILAGYGIRKFDSIEDILNDWIIIKEKFEPDMKKNKNYQVKYEQWLKIYDSLEEYKIIY